MLFTSEFKAGIRAGRITRTYRSWKRPQARLGRQYNLAPDGVIEVTNLCTISPGRITDPDAIAAGFADARTLRSFLKSTEPVYLVEFNYLGSGLIRQPEQAVLPESEIDGIMEKLHRTDRRSDSPWTEKLLQAINASPGRRAAEIAPSFGWDTPTLKRQVRKLKALGLTISLETGYRLSDRGNQAVTLLNSRQAEAGDHD